MLEVQDLRKRLGATLALDSCNLQVAAGERVVIVGANGAGKSTLLKIIAGVLAPDAGAVAWKSHSLTSGPAQVRCKMGYVPEAADPPPQLSIAELLHFVAALKGTSPIERSLVESLALGDLLDARISELSLGQRRRACLAAALTGDPELLILDEPSNGLDAASLEVVAKILRASAERTIVLATHDADFARQVATRQVRMAAGRIIGDSSEKSGIAPTS